VRELPERPVRPKDDYALLSLLTYHREIVDASNELAFKHRA
jgi:dTDP-glucose pyrophosphorylase